MQHSLMLDGSSGVLDAFAAACVEMAVISGTAAGLSGRPHAQHSSAAENWSRLHLDSAQLEGILESLFSGHHAQAAAYSTNGFDLIKNAAGCNLRRKTE